MKRLHEVIEVPRNRADVFNYVSDFGRIEQWDPGVVSSKKLSPGPVGEGMRFLVEVSTAGGTEAMHYTVTRFDPPNRVVLEGEGRSIRAVDDIRFSTTGSGTLIEYTAEITLLGAAGKVECLVGPVLDRIGKRAMNGLQQALRVEAQPASDSLLRDLLDRLVVPGAIGFTRFGYAWRKGKRRALTDSLAGRVIVVTGATSGLGRVVAEQLAGLQARVIMVGRSADKLERARREIVDATGNAEVVTERADLSLVAEVRALASRLLEREQALHVLVNNAAILPTARTLTKEGLETAFATDLLSPFLLTELLLPRLRDSAPARIINVSSGGMYLSGINLDDLQNERGSYDGSRAYARAKRGLVMLTERWAELLEGSGVVVNAMHPGWADTPGVQDSLPGFHRFTRAVLRTPEQGADTIVWLAAAPEAGSVSGKFWLDREPHLTALFPGTAGGRAKREKLVNELTRLAA
jgi:NAD(P)-dependent dehydrogenase (short-subunit alcohol dehydrogenase family)/carbon monoxide dehydrogenase subunit G